MSPPPPPPLFNLLEARLRFTTSTREALKNKAIKPLLIAFSQIPGSENEKKLTLDQAFRVALEEEIISKAACENVLAIISLVINAVAEGICTASTPFVLLGDVLDCLPLDQCDKIFTFVEKNVTTWKSNTFYSAGKNYLLRMCNDLLRRLSKSQNTVFCGRIQLFLARLFPLSEKSGLNLQSQFNLENITVYNTSEQESTLGQKHVEEREEGMEVEEGEMGDDEAPTSSSIPIDYNLYRKFWSLQDYFRNPVQCYEKISWKTFLKAVMASDFAIPKFRYLEKLLLVHGHWCYSRLANMVLYFFYKNAMFVALLFWYQFYCGFSGSSMIDQWYLIFFNLLFSSLPQLIVGVLDKDVPADVLIAVPQLYTSGQNMEEYQPYMFWMNMIDALYQSLICFFIPYFIYYDSDVDIFSWGTPITTTALFTIILHLAIETKTWTWLHVSSCVFSIALFFIVALVYNASCPVCYHPSNPYWIMERLMADPMFYLTCLITPVVALLPRFLYRTLQGTLFPTQLQLGRQLSKMPPETCNQLLSRCNPKKETDPHKNLDANSSPESSYGFASDAPKSCNQNCLVQLSQQGNELFQPSKPEATRGLNVSAPSPGAQLWEEKGHFSVVDGQGENLGLHKGIFELDPTLGDETIHWKSKGNQSDFSLLNWITSTPLFNGISGGLPWFSSSLQNERQDCTALRSYRSQGLRDSSEQNTTCFQEERKKSPNSCLKTESLESTFL